MVTLTMLETADYWIAAGGPKNRATEWVAIAMGESSLETTAISSVGARSLWQIMPEHFPEYGYSLSQWADPAVNASIAVQLSGHGTNCAAWDSCYTDIEASGRLEFLSWPQPGSADYDNLAVVSAALRTDKLGGAVPPPGSFPTGPLVGAISEMDKIANRIYPALLKMGIYQRMQLDRMFTPGWRP